MSRLPFKTMIRGVNQLDSYGTHQITHIVSILDPGAAEPVWPAGFGKLPRLDLQFHDSTAAATDSVMFSSEHVEAIIAFADRIATAAEPQMLVHCTHGMSRSTACTAIIHAHIRAAFPGVELFAEILRILEIAWPILHIVELDVAHLGRGGDLIAGASAVNRYQLAERPD